MNNQPYGINFSQPELTTVKGQPMMVSSGEPTEDFWNSWKSDKAGVRAQGLSVRRDDKTGKFVVKKWTPVGQGVPATQQTMQDPVAQAAMQAFPGATATERVYPADIHRSEREYGHPHGNSGMVDEFAQVPPHLVPPDHPSAPYASNIPKSPLSTPLPQNEPAYRVMSVSAKLTHKLRCALIDHEQQISNQEIARILQIFHDEYIAKG